MPVRIVVHLAPAGDHAPLLPPHTGPAVYYALLNALRAATGGASWASAVHDAPRYKPVSVTPVMDENDRLAGVDSHSVRFEVGVLVDELTAPLLVALKEASGVRIARCHYRIADLDVADAQPYPQLAEAADPAADSWSMRLITPVAFETAREEGARRLRTLPEPEWVFGSLLTRWQHLGADTPLHPATAEFIGTHLAVADWSLRAGEHLVLPGDTSKGRKDLVWRGSVGAVTYQLVNPGTVARPVRASLDTLARFAAYAGLGDRTNVGMGYMRAQPAQVEEGDKHARS